MRFPTLRLPSSATGGGRLRSQARGLGDWSRARPVGPKPSAPSGRRSKAERRELQGAPPAVRLCRLPGSMKRGGTSETERSACATIPFPGLKSPNVSLSRSDQRKKQSGSEAKPDGRLSNSLFLFERSMSSWPVLFENSISISHLNRQSNPPRAFPRGIEVCLHAASRARRNAPVSSEDFGTAVPHPAWGISSPKPLA